MISLTERSVVREIGTGTLIERSEFSVIVSEFRKIGTGPLNENKAKPRFEFSGIGRYTTQGQ